MVRRRLSRFVVVVATAESFRRFSLRLLVLILEFHVVCVEIEKD